MASSKILGEESVAGTVAAGAAAQPGYGYGAGTGGGSTGDAGGKGVSAAARDSNVFGTGGTAPAGSDGTVARVR